MFAYARYTHSILRTDSTGPTSYFVSKFKTIQTPKLGVTNYEERLSSSVVGEFNRSQREAGRKECCNGTSHNWMKAHRPKVAICPHKQDYCDQCTKMKVDIYSKQTTINRLLRSADASPELLKELEDEMDVIRKDLGVHCKEAQDSHAYHIEVIDCCVKDWEKISDLSGSVLEDSEELTTLKRTFTLVISADYQMSKLIPNWGSSPQPGSTYYLQKLSHDILGIVQLHDQLYTNCAGTNKNWYTMAWAAEMVQQGKLDFICLSFLNVGHTKFAPDLLFLR